MKPIDYLCKICSKPGVSYYDDNCPISDVELWRQAICCKRCYDFRDQYGTAKRQIEKLCVGLINLRQTRSKLAYEAENQIKERLIAATRNLSTMCSNFYRVQNIWTSEVVEILMGRPDGCNRAINAFRAGYEAIGKSE